MNSLLKKLPLDIQKNLKEKKMLSFEKPMLATLTKDYFSNSDWVFERKFDGERCFIYKNNNKVFLKSRNNKKLDATYPEIVQAAQNLKVNQIILDGEIVAFHGNETSFEKLQSRLGLKDSKKALETGVQVYIYVFDILYLDGYDLTNLPWQYRKSILQKSILFQDPIRYTEHQNNDGLKFFKTACSKHWEGLIAKQKNAPYSHARSTDWLKFKCIQDQELVIAGYTLPQRSRIGFGALLLGYYKNEKLIFAGKVGTGFSDEFLTMFIKKLQAIETTKNYFSSSIMAGPKTRFVIPKYVAQIGFENWTKRNILRQPRFQGLRYDKKPKDVVLELPEKI